MYDIKKMNIWKKEANRRKTYDYLQSDISDLNLSVRSYNCLKRAGCDTIGDIIRLIENDENGLRKIRNLGNRSEAEILETIKIYKEQFDNEPYKMEESSAEQLPIVRRKQMHSAGSIWNSDIESFPISKFALSNLKENGINKVKDLYANNPKNEPGWYAVRELFEKIPKEALL